MRRSVPATPPMKPSEIRALPDGTKVLIRWIGGNGPHPYTLRMRSCDGKPPYTVYGCYEMPDGRETESGEVLSWDHEARWGDYPSDHVWLIDGG